MPKLKSQVKMVTPSGPPVELPGDRHNSPTLLQTNAAEPLSPISPVIMSTESKQKDILGGFKGPAVADVITPWKDSEGYATTSQTSGVPCTVSTCDTSLPQKESEKEAVNYNGHSSGMESSENIEVDLFEPFASPLPFSNKLTGTSQPAPQQHAESKKSIQTTADMFKKQRSTSKDNMEGTAKKTLRNLDYFAKCKPSGEKGPVTGAHVLTYLQDQGLQLDDPRLKVFVKQCETWDFITEDRAKTLIANDIIKKALKKELAIKDFKDFTESFKETFQTVRSNMEGSTAAYIPQLANQNPNYWAASVCSLDGQRYSVGDADVPFCVQGASKPITYCGALEINGEAIVHKHVGREPSGRNHDDRALMQRKGRGSIPHNPYINAGAIMTGSLVKMDANEWDRYKWMMGIWQKLSGGVPVAFQNDTFMGERATSSRNFCLAYMMEEEQAFPFGTNLNKTLEAYFTWCSIESTTRSMATLAATLANGGMCPTTTERIFTHQTVTNCLSLMMSCGMYDYSGRFAFDIGFPAKSGISGVLLVVIPGVCGMATFSPRVDKCGNSVRGVDFCMRLSQRLGYHVFHQKNANRVRRPSLQSLDEQNLLDLKAQTLSDDDLDRLRPSLWWSAARGDQQRVRQLVVRGLDVKSLDYDKRSALHLAASEGHDGMVRLLVSLEADINVKDHLGNTPMDDAIREHRNGAKRTLQLAARSNTNSKTPTPNGVSDGVSDVKQEGYDLFAYFKGHTLVARGKEYFKRKTLVEVLDSYGIGTDSDPRFGFLETMQETVTREGLDAAAKMEPLIFKTLSGQLVVPNFSLFCEKCEELFSKMTEGTSGNDDGGLAGLSCNLQKSGSLDSLDMLRSASKDSAEGGSKHQKSTQSTHDEKRKGDKDALHVLTVDGQSLHLGPTDDYLCAGDLISLVLFSVAIELLSLESVMEFVGTESSGVKSCTPALNSDNLPYNPFMWNGVLALCSLLEEKFGDAIAVISDYWAKLCGSSSVDSPVQHDEVFEEQDKKVNNYRVNALLFASLDLQKFPNQTPPNVVMDTFFHLRAIKTNVKELASISAVLANGGKHPMTNMVIFQAETVKYVMTMMYSAGCEAQSGELSFKVGVPAKSSREGAMVVVVPHIMGFCVFSPEVQEHGVSISGLKFCVDFGNEFHCHVLAGSSTNSAKQDPCLYHFQTDMELCNQLLYAAECGDSMTLSHLHQLGFSLDYTDYDYRSAAHVAAANGHVKLLKYLFKKDADMTVKDRWGVSPMDDAVKKGHHKAAAVIRDFLRNEDIGGLSDCGSTLSTISSRLAKLNAKDTKSQRSACPVAAKMGANFDCIAEGEEDDDEEEEEEEEDTPRNQGEDIDDLDCSSV